MKTCDEVAAWLEERGADEVLLANGFDEAFLGIVGRCGQPVAVKTSLV